jgi:hypothetical protein
LVGKVLKNKEMKRENKDYKFQDKRKDNREQTRENQGVKNLNKVNRCNSNSILELEIFWMKLKALNID